MASAAGNSDALQRRAWRTLGGLVGIALLANLGFFLAAPRSLPAGWRHWLPGFDVMALALDGGDLWVGGRDGLVRLERATGRELRRLDLPYVRALARDREGDLWIGHHRGLSRLRGGSGELEAVTPESWAWASAGRVNALLQTSGGLLIGTDGGLWRRLDGGAFESLTVPGLLSPMVNVVAEDPISGLWLGSAVPPKGGLSIVQPGGTATFDVDRGLPHNNITAIAFLDQRTALVGTGFYQRGGAALFERTAAGWALASTLSVANGLAGPKVRSIHLDPAGVLWVGSEYNGVAYRRGAGSRWQRLGREDGLSDGEVKCFAEGPDGSLLLGTLRGLSVLSREARSALP